MDRLRKKKGSETRSGHGHVSFSTVGEEGDGQRQEGKDRGRKTEEGREADGEVERQWGREEAGKLGPADRSSHGSRLIELRRFVRLSLGDNPTLFALLLKKCRFNFQS